MALSKGQASFNELYYNYKKRASRKGLSFELNEEQFRELTSKNCVYCNSEPKHSNNRPYRKAKHRYNGTYFYNSIDRVDNSKGYIITNCLTSCGDCNKMRNTVLTVEEMKIAMNAVLEFRRK